MKDNNNNLRKADFWESDCFVEKELVRIWEQYHQEETEREEAVK